MRGIFPNPEFEILPGLFVTVRIPLGKNENAILIPEAALGSDQAGRYVWVVDEDDVVQRVNVQVGSKYEDLIVIQEGLKPDDWVIVDGIQRVRSKAKVSPERTELPDSGGEIENVKQGSTPPAESDEEADAASSEPPADTGSTPEKDAPEKDAAAEGK